MMGGWSQYSTLRLEVDPLEDGLSPLVLVLPLLMDTHLRERVFILKQNTHHYEML